MDIITYGHMVDALSREWEKGQGKSLCMRNVVYVNSVKDKRSSTILDFELFPTLKKPFTCPVSYLKPLGPDVF